MKAYIDRYRDAYGVEPICRVLQMAPSCYWRHAARQRDPQLRSARARRDESLMADIQSIWHANWQVYGADKVWLQLKREGIRVARCTVERLMRAMGLQGARRGKKVRTTTPDTSAPCPLDHVNRQFKASRPNELWVSDFTYVSTWQGWLYVAFVIDVYARRIVGWRVRQVTGTPRDRIIRVMNPIDTSRASILVTGGAGYIGSHTTLALLQAGHEVVVLDNLSNSSPESLRRVAELAGRAPRFVRGDIRDRALLDRLLAEHPVRAVLHFAGLKAVGESVREPLAYYDNNVAGTVTLCQAMATAGVFRLVFSSSATVYGEPGAMPIREDHPTGQPTNPYGRSKLVVEEVLRDLSRSDPRWAIALLRYFNPVGAHESGRIGEDPNGIPNNLLPYISQVAAGKLKELAVFGDDYLTPDGTGVRDYIHVLDLAQGHLKALQAIEQAAGVHTWNLGTGQGYSVLEMVRAFEHAAGRTVPYRIAPRRPGDIAECWADPAKAAAELGWRAELGLDRMMADAWRWQSLNPDGYPG